MQVWRNLESITFSYNILGQVKNTFYVNENKLNSKLLKLEQLWIPLFNFFTKSFASLCNFISFIFYLYIHDSCDWSQISNFKFGCNSHADREMNWFDFGVQWSRSLWPQTSSTLVNIQHLEKSIPSMVTPRRCSHMLLKPMKDLNVMFRW